MDDFNHRSALDILREMDADERSGATRALNDRIVNVMGAVFVPVIGAEIKQLKADNAKLEARITELETKLDTAARLDAIEQRLDALPSATVRRIA